jgi:pimeloyl-ACP methyl ester carboxylesterase
MVSELHLSATPQSGANLISPTLFSDVSSRIRSSEQIIYGLTRIYNTISRSPVFSKRALSYMYRSSPADLATLERAFSDLQLSDWLTLIANRAVHSSLDEVVSLQRDWISDLFEMKVPVTFWHGTEDPICPIEEIQALAANLENASFKVFDGAGHFLISQKLDDLAAAFATIRRAK